MPVVAEEEGNSLLVSISRIDGVNDFSFGFAKEVFKLGDFLQVQAAFEGNWTEDGYVGGGLLFEKEIGPFQLIGLGGVQVDAQLVDPHSDLTEKVKAVVSHGIWKVGGGVGVDVSKQLKAPITLNLLWSESYAIKEGTVYRQNSTLFANLSFGFNGII